MYRAPNLPMPEVVAAHSGAKELWLKALARPEKEYKCRAAEAIALAHRHGIKDLEFTIAPLREELARANQHPAVSLAVADALIEMDARDAAPHLLQLAESGDSDLRNLIEPALARWDFGPARTLWLARLGERTARPHSLILGIQALALVREEKAAEPLQELVRRNDVSGLVRLEAARALGQLRAEGLEKDAERLVAEVGARGIGARLAAVALLAKHQSDESVRLLQQLAKDPDPTVTGHAVVRLIEIDAKHALANLESLLGHADANLRKLAVEILRREATPERVHQLAARLDDFDPEVRKNARQALLALAGKPEFRERVLAEAGSVLAGNQWRGLEQAALLLGQLDHKPVAPRLVELLTFESPHVYIAAAWGLRKLAVAETLPKVVDYVEAKQRKLRAEADHPNSSFVLFDHQLAQLNQFIGSAKYKSADKVLREFIPRMEKPMKNAICQESRAAAIWALGMIHEDVTIPELVPVLEARLNDVMSLPREDSRVCRMAAVTLGRMKANEALSSLKRYCKDQKPSLDPITNACGWAIEQITGQVMQPPEPIREDQRERFFLTPND
jgi:HEAT repeat protein